MFQYSGTKANVTISGNLATGIPEPTANQTVVNATADGVASGTTVYTVPANKIFYCMNASLSVNQSGSNKLTIDGTAVLVLRAGGDGDQISLAGACPIFTAAAGKTIVTSTTGTGTVVLSGYLVSV